MVDGNAAIAATEAAAEATAEAVETVQDDKAAALQDAQRRIDDAEKLARQITDTALATSLGVQISEARTQWQTAMDSHRAETAAQLAEIRTLAERKPEAAPSVVALLPSTPPASDQTPTPGTPPAPPSIAVITPGDVAAPLAAATPPAQPRRKILI